MTFIVNDKLQAVRQAAANAREKREVDGCMLFANDGLQLFQRLRVAGRHARLQYVPQILDRVEVGTPWRPLIEVCYSFSM